MNEEMYETTVKQCLRRTERILMFVRPSVIVESMACERREKQERDRYSMALWMSVDTAAFVASIER